MNHAIILLAGKGTRLSKETPKQFINICDRPLYIFSVEAFDRCKEIDTITLVVIKEYINQVKKEIKEHGIKKVNLIVEGGETRQESVRNGLTALKASDEDIVLIHDGARLFVSDEIIKRNISACLEHHAVITAIPAINSIILGNETVTKYLDRREVFQVQTPQTFKYKLIYDAHIKNKDVRVTDDASLLYKDIPVYIVEGSSLNFKVTAPEDLWLTKELLGVNNNG